MMVSVSSSSSSYGCTLWSRLITGQKKKIEKKERSTRLLHKLRITPFVTDKSYTIYLNTIPGKHIMLVSNNGLFYEFNCTASLYIYTDCLYQYYVRSVRYYYTKSVDFRQFYQLNFRNIKATVVWVHPLIEQTGVQLTAITNIHIKTKAYYIHYIPF